MKNEAITYMVKGLIAQLMKRVRATGFGVFAALTTRAKSIFTMMGYIMKKRQMAMGRETWYKDKASRVYARVGAIFPSVMPAPIQTMTQMVRYFSKIDRCRDSIGSPYELTKS
jgi:hypothetical protein